MAPTRISLFLSATFLVLAKGLWSQEAPLPIIDMHLHANAADGQGPPPLAFCAPIQYPTYDPGLESWPQVFMKLVRDPPCEHPFWSPETTEELQKQTLAALDRYNIIGATSGPFVQEYRAASPDRIIPGLPSFFIEDNWPSVKTVRNWIESGDLKYFGEVAIQYKGMEPGEPSLEPYLALAEEYDIPVGFHIGTGPPGVPYFWAPNYRAKLHSALVLEEVLISHPKLRVSIGHAGWPMLDDLLAVMWTHPQVYVDLGVIIYALPQEEFYRYLRRIVESGFGKRVMFGSDQMIWPEAIGYSIQVLESADFLSPEQKRDIFYNNAARFLRLSEKEIARHHGN